MRGEGLKYLNIINSVFSNLKIKPRVKQVLIISQILTLFLDNNRENVVLSASTGAGKSIIGAVVSECLYIINDSTEYKNSKSYILMQNNALVNQYYNTFSEHLDYINVKGAGNYKCLLLECKADECILKHKSKTSNISFKKCETCNYIKMLNSIQGTPNIITNYTYYLTISKTRSFKNVLTTVFDLAHLLNDIYCSHANIKITKDNINKLIALYNNLQLTNSESIKNLNTIVKMFDSNVIVPKTYSKLLLLVLDSVNLLFDLLDSIKDKLLLLNDMINFKIYSKACQYLTYNYINKITDFFDYNYLHVVDIQEGIIEIEPIFMKDTYSQIKKSKYNLFMSATINKLFMTLTLGLPLNKTGFIKTDSYFKPENKQIIFINHKSYNYNNLNDNSTINDIKSIIKNITLTHKDQKGIILVPSFKLMNNIKSNISKHHKLYIQELKTPLSETLLYFKNLTKPSILISPSLFEGIDLIGKLSLFQIMIKVPYAPLNNKRVKYIMLNYPNIYSIQSLYKIIQGFGRSTRDHSDSSVTYCLDTNIKRLYDSKFNIWDNLFKAQNL